MSSSMFYRATLRSARFSFGRDVSNRVSAFVLVAIVLPIVAFGLLNDQSVVAQDLDATEKIKPSLAKKIKKYVIAPLESGDHDAFRYQFGKLLARLSTDDFDDVEAFGESENVGSFKSAFFGAWQDAVLAGRVPADFKLKRQVVMYLAASAEFSTANLIQEIQKHELMTAGDVSLDWSESRNFFKNVELLKGRIADHEAMGIFVDQALAPYRKSRSTKKEFADILNQFQSDGESFSKAKNEVLEKEAIRRLQRFNSAAEQLLKPNEFEVSLIAALFFNEDVVSLKTFFGSAESLDAEELKDPGLTDSVVKTIADVKASGNTAIRKASLLSEGLYQWIRGRYGIGPLGDGMLKAEFTDRQQNVNVSADSIKMPEDFVTYDPYSKDYDEEKSGKKACERRHFETWDLEFRPLQTFINTETETEITEGGCGRPVTSISSSTITATRKLTGQDNSFPYRIVGTEEYSKSLENLDQLVSTSSADEIKVYDKLITQMPEFILCSGASAGVTLPKPVQSQPVEPVDGDNLIKRVAAPNLVVPGPGQNADSHKKHSLAWAMALARVELNATRSMYVKGADGFTPAAGKAFGMTEYYYVLLDDAAAHLKTLEADNDFKAAIKKLSKIADSKTVAYLRRLKLIGSMLVTLKKSGTPMISEKASKFLKNVEDLNLAFELQVALSLEPRVVELGN